jgi:DNA-binding beta-propeller fold protein YncE
VLRRKTIACITLLAWCAADPGRTAEAPLALESKIPLGDVSGRIDHLAYDPSRQRLYVAELGNDTIGIVDLKAGSVLRGVPGLDEPQGIGYEPGSDTIYVANGGDGSVRLFSGADFAPVASVALGKDADNVRIDRDAHRVYVGYGAGAIAIIDAVTRRHVADIPLAGHPEGFQLDPASDRIYVNVPDAGEIAVLSREKLRQVASWKTGGLRANYPLVLDPQGGHAIAVFRRPARLQVYEISSGRVVGGIDTCSDSDDVFVDARRRRVYVICGEGVIETLDTSKDIPVRIGRFATSEGSRTGLLVPAIDRLFVAVRATRGEPASIWVLRPDDRAAGAN